MLVVSLVGMPLSTQAALIETDQVLRQAQTQSDRRVSDLVARADVQQALQSYGVTPQAAQERVAALTDTEIQQITGKLDSLPAGAIGAGETVLIVVLVIVAIYVILQHIYPRR
jgi:hypothetical protein